MVVGSTIYYAISAYCIVAVYHMVEEWTTCMRLLSWRRHQGTMLKNCVFILPVSDPAKQAAQVVKHHVFDERTVIT